MSLRGVALAAAAGAAFLTWACAADPGAPTEGAGATASQAVIRIFPRGPVDGQPFGGLSGLAWDNNAKALIAVSDRGDAFSMPTRPEDPARFVAKLRRPSRMFDPEALLWQPEGRWIVAFEGGGGLGFYRGAAAALGETPEAVLRPKAWSELPENARIETLAALDFGRLFAIAEGGTGAERQAWIIDGAVLSPRSYPIEQGFLPVDATALPNGDILVLERRFNGFIPPFFSTRLALIPASSLDASDGPLAVSQRREMTGILPSENWEGVTLAAGPSGALIWLVSDDNFQWPQRTLLARMPLEYVIDLMRPR